MFKVPERYRVKLGKMGSDESYGNNGLFVLKNPKLKRVLRVIASEGFGWEHVSVSLSHRTPSWPEMCFVKDLFWEPVDMVVQFHPVEEDYVNHHPYCLHLWRKCKTNDFCETPPIQLIGPKNDNPVRFK